MVVLVGAVGFDAAAQEDAEGLGGTGMGDAQEQCQHRGSG